MHQDLDHVADVTTLVSAGIELPVAIGACASLAETVVTVRVDNAALRQAPEIAASRLHLLASLQDDRSNALTRELIGAEQAGWTGPYDDNPGSCPVDAAGLGATDGKFAVFTPTLLMLNVRQSVSSVCGPFAVAVSV